MPEHQNTEYKSTWHDDYLKWVCGFANAQGGVIFTGKDISLRGRYYYRSGSTKQELTGSSLSGFLLKTRDDVIESRATVKTIESCKEAGLLEPELTERDGGYWEVNIKE